MILLVFRSQVLLSVGENCTTVSILEQAAEFLQTTTYLDIPDTGGFIKLESDPNSLPLRRHTSLADFVPGRSRAPWKRSTASLSAASSRIFTSAQFVLGIYMIDSTALWIGGSGIGSSWRKKV